LDVGKAQRIAENFNRLAEVKPGFNGELGDLIQPHDEHSKHEHPQALERQQKMHCDFQYGFDGMN
jgi:hypothetical protein